MHQKPRLVILGHITSHGQIKPNNEKIEKVSNAPVSKSKTGVTSLCRTIGFIREFGPNCAKWLKPLHDRLEANAAISLNGQIGINNLWMRLDKR
jgi:hypothetical protein